MRELRAALASVAFLTRVPVRASLSGEDVRRAAAYFPLVGAALGALTGLVAAALARTMSATLAAAIAVAVGVVLTGALHVDALADTADATGGATRERALEIMRDHAIGAYGATAIALDLIVRVAVIATLAHSFRTVAYLAAAGAVSRAAAVGVGAALPYAREAGGLGAAVAGVPARRATIAAVIAIVLAVVVARGLGLAAATVAAAVAVLAALGWRRWLGGVTGDTLGATSELAELAALVVVAALV
jgi:adenosylcobinamide-GDP ribazoletransferase